MAKVASIYIFAGRENVNDFGARVAEVYRNQVWERLPAALTDPILRERRQAQAELEDIIERFEQKKTELNEQLERMREPDAS